MKCIFLNNVTSPENFKTINVLDALNDIKSEKYKALLDKLPPATDKKAYTEAKRNLPAWAFNGEFKGGTKNDHFTESNGLFHIDIDGIDEPEKVKYAMCYEIPEIFALWLSPSGKGLKGLLRIPDDLIHNDSDFKKAYTQLDAYLSAYDVKIDRACKDVRRMCFVGSDKGIYINENAPAFMFNMTQWNAKPTANLPKKQTTNSAVNSGRIYIDRCVNIIMIATSGGYHHARLRAGKLAGGFIAAGMVSESEVMQALSQASDSISSQYGDSAEVIQREQKTIYDAIQYGKGQPCEVQQHGNGQTTAIMYDFVPPTPTPAYPTWEEEPEEEEPRTTFKKSVLPIKHIDTITDYLNASIYSYSTKATRHAALAFICQVVSRDFISDSGDKCSLMIGNVGATVGQLSDINNALESLCVDVGISEDDVRLDRMSHADLKAHYMVDNTSGKLLYMPPDFGHTIRAAQKQTSLAMDSFLSELQQFHDKSSHVFRDKKKSRVINPVCNLYANFSETDLFTFGKLSNNDSLFNLFLTQINYADEFTFNSKMHTPRTDTDTFNALKAHIAAIQNKPNTLLPNVKTPNSGKYVMPWAVNPADYSQLIQDACGNNTHLLGRTMRQFVNLATAIAAWNDNEAVTASLAEDCCHYVCGLVSELVESLAKRASDDVSPDTMTRVLSIIHKAGKDGIAESWVCKDCAGYRRLSEDERENLIMHLVKTKEITQIINDGNKKGGRKGKKFFIR